MSPRLLYPLSAEHARSREPDRLDAWTATARMPGCRRPHWAPIDLVVAA
jgi:hypothetical protein